MRQKLRRCRHSHGNEDPAAETHTYLRSPVPESDKRKKPTTQ
ncbi:hypothetical protein M3J09_010934 [Ascochyta lentis]